MRFRLFLVLVIVGVAPLFFLWNIASGTIENHMVQERVTSLRASTTAIATHVANVPAYMEHPVTRDHANVGFTARAVDLDSRIVISNTMGVVMFDSIGGIGRQWVDPLMMEALDDLNAYGVTIDDEAAHIRIAVAITNANGMVIGVVLLEHSAAEAPALLSGIGSQMMWLVGVIGAVVVVLVFFVVSWFVRPLRRVLIALRFFSEGHFERRIKVTGNNEISAIGVAFNDMAQKLETVETARQEFVSNVSHELRTPLASIKVLSDSLLLDPNADVATHREFLGDITTEVDRMADIVNELLTLVRLDEVDLPLNIDTISLNDLIRDCVKRLTPLAALQHVQISFPQVRTVNIDGDEMKLTLAISNLIENAVKYSHPHGQPVEISMRTDAKNAFITITDHGIGIDEEDQGKVFTRFYRADKGRDRETGGTGLGLAITHKTVLLHGGSVKLSSKLGVGSVFTVRLPINQQETNFP